MKSCIFLFVLGVCIESYAQPKSTQFYLDKWSSNQLLETNTAKDLSFLTEAEKQAIMFVNLARMYPKEFASKVVANYYGNENYGDYLKGSSYQASLLKDLNKAQPVGKLVFDQAAYESAQCFALEQGKTGKTGHDRIQCKSYFYGECVSYGMETGLDIAMHWLVDHDVPSLGHREICLSARYTKIGLSKAPHKSYGVCTVADFVF